MNKIVSYLEKVHLLLESPERWTRGTLARGSRGQPIDPTSAQACRWCLQGAVTNVAGLSGYWSHVMAELDRAASPYSLPYFNDNHTHAEVLAVIRKAQEAVRQPPKEHP